MPVIDAHTHSHRPPLLRLSDRAAQCNQLLLRYLGSALMLFAVGCAWKGEGADDAHILPSDHWSIRPVAMRVFPSTRFAEGDGGTMLEARIEMTDEAGDTTKAVGHFHFELFRDDGAAPAGTPAPASGKLLYSWDVPMITLAQNRDFFDPVTRTYLCRLKVDEPAITRESSLLRVTFRPVEGERLTAQSMLEAMRKNGAK